MFVALFLNTSPRRPRKAGTYKPSKEGERQKQAGGKGGLGKNFQGRMHQMTIVYTTAKEYKEMQIPEKLLNC